MAVIFNTFQVLINCYPTFIISRVIDIFQFADIITRK